MLQVKSPIAKFSNLLLPELPLEFLGLLLLDAKICLNVTACKRFYSHQN